MCPTRVRDETREVVDLHGQRWLMRHEFSVLLFRTPDQAQIEAYEVVGVDQLVVTPWEIHDPSNALLRIEEYAAEVGIVPPSTTTAKGTSTRRVGIVGVG